MPIQLDGLASGALVLYAIAAAFVDLRSRRIPNRLTYGFTLLGLALHGLEGRWGTSLLGLALGLGIMLGLALLMPGALGMGDVKMGAAIGALGGFPLILHALLWGWVFGGIYTLVIMTLTGRLRPLIERLRALLGEILSATRRGRWVELNPPEFQAAVIPLGVALAAGTLFSLWRGL